MQDEYSLQGVPQMGGGYFTGSSPRSDEQQKWAKITGSTTISGVTYYSWTEQTPWASGFILANGGMFGVVSPSVRNPIIEVNGLALVVGNFVKVRQAYFDAVYDWVFFAESNPLSGGGGGGSGRLLARQVFVNAGNYTYTQTAGTTAVLIQMLGGGGGAGGVKGGASAVGASGGGGGGGYTEKFMNPSTINGATITVGAGGTAGNGTPTSGGNGGNSLISGTALSAVGGFGSAGVNASSTPAQSAGGGGGTQSATGDINVQGSDGTFGFTFISGAFLDAVGGKGGQAAGPYGGGGQGGGNGSAGQVGVQYGSGGSGASSILSVSFSGGAGADGIVVINEYS